MTKSSIMAMAVFSALCGQAQALSVPSPDKVAPEPPRGPGPSYHQGCVGLSVEGAARGQLGLLRSGRESFVEGVPGEAYSLRVTNSCPGRVLAVVSVDGLNVITGEKAGYSQSGYVVAPGGSVRVSGWRKGMETTASFVFSSPSGSYAGRVGKPENIGVIGAAFFAERQAEVAFAPSLSMGSAGSAGAARDSHKADSGLAREASAPAARASMERESKRAESLQSAPSLGTGHGERREDKAVSTVFERASPSPFKVSSIRYESRERLIEMGLIRSPRGPNPFPEAGFVKDPPPAGWR